MKILISLDNLNIDNVIFGKMKLTENSVTHVNMSNKIVTYINYFEFDSKYRTQAEGNVENAFHH